MKIRQPITLFAIFLTPLLTSCTSPATPTQLPHGGNILYISDVHNIGILDTDNGNLSLLENDMFIQSLNYDKQRNRLVMPVDAVNEDFKGLLLYGGQKQQKLELQDQFFAPVHLYQHNNYYVMDSARVLHEGKYTVTDTAIYDVEKKEMIQKFPIPGVVRDIVGSGSKAYVSSNYHPGSPELQGKHKSNIYEIDIEKKTMRKLFAKDLPTVPYELAIHDGFVYGVFQATTFVAEGTQHDTLVKIDPTKGEVVKQIPLAPYATDLVIPEDGKYAFVSHFPDLAQTEIRIDKPISRIDLSTWEVQQATGDYRAAAIVEQNGNLYFGSDEKPEITVVNEQTLQVEKRIPTGELLPIYVANERKSIAALR